MFRPSPQRKARPVISEDQTSFPKGYVSVLADSRVPNNALVDMTNMTLEQDSVPRPRPSLVAYGPTLPGTCIGVGTFIKVVSGKPQEWQIIMCNVGGVGKVYVNQNGGAWTLIGGSYDASAWATFCQIGATTSSGTISNRAYISNGVNNMSYYDIDAGTIVTYTALSTPAAPTATQTGMVGTNFTYSYKISANNATGETAASVAGTAQVSTIRDQWIPASQYITVTWSAVTGATSYNIYVSDNAGNECYLATVTGLSFKDDGSQAINPFRLFPAGNSTAGPILSLMWNSNDQLFGVGDPNNSSFLWYSGQGEHAGDFSPFNDGGYVAINYGGDTIPTNVRAFRDGKGNPVATVLSRGSAGRGRLHHVSFDSQTVGDTVLVSPNVYEANGQDGTVSPRGVIEANNSLYYPTGTDFKSTGTKPNVINILSTDSIAQQIQPDVAKLNLSAMDRAVGLEYQDKLYWALPVGSSTNNEIWVLDLSRGGLWILRWTVAAQHLWLYEDTSGATHFMALVGNVIMEFTRSVATQDNGVPFKTRLASGAMVFDKAGATMAAIQDLHFRLLYAKGTIRINVYGLGDGGVINLLGSVTYTQTVSFTGWEQYLWSEGDMYSDDVGAVDFFSQAVSPVPIEVDEILNQLSWELITEGANADYFLSSVHTRGKGIPGLYYGD